LRKHAAGDKRSISPDAMNVLMSCRWEGNARELENVIERALALSEQREIRTEDLPVPNREDALKPPLEESLLDSAVEHNLTLRELEDRYIDAILEHTGGNKVQAARILGINRRTLYRRGEHNHEHEQRHHQAHS
jgi:DNA-binding NtrC family response regulator